MGSNSGSFRQPRAGRPSLPNLKSERLVTSHQKYSTKEGYNLLPQHRLTNLQAGQPNIIQDINAVVNNDMIKLAKIEAKNNKKKSDFFSLTPHAIKISAFGTKGEFIQLPSIDVTQTDTILAQCSPAKASSKERRVGRTNLWLHPMGRFFTNGSFLKIKTPSGKVEYDSIIIIDIFLYCILILYSDLVIIYRYSGYNY